MTAPAPAPASFFSRLQNFERSKSHDGSIYSIGSDDSGGNAEAGPSTGNGSRSSSVHASGTSTPVIPHPDMRRAVSLRVGYGRPIDTSAPSITSFGAAGSTLSPEPRASRHALFSHHRIPSSTATSTISGCEAGPSSPSPSSVSSTSAFSPASAFLSHFTSARSPPASVIAGSSLSHTPAQPPTIAPDAPGARVLNKYTLGKVLGRGGFSTVRLATTDTGEQFACKIVKRDDLSDRSGSLEKFEEEIQIWSRLPRHPSLLTLLEMERTDYATFLISPVLLGGNLLDVLRKEGGSDKTARKWFPGVVTAVAAMHEGYDGFKGRMMHGDLKLDNFLVDTEGRVMVCDFYMAKLLDEEDDTVLIPPRSASTSRNRRQRSRPRHGHTINVVPGSARNPSTSSRTSTLSNSSDLRNPSSSPTPNPSPLPAHFPSASLPYAPPELLSAPPCSSGLAQDIWALGVVLYALLTGKLPFVDAFDPRLQMKILRNQWTPPENVGREWLDCLKGCLAGDVRKRWTIERVKMSDAVLGWKEVKAKQRSRSRSRQRIAGAYGGDAQGYDRGRNTRPTPLGLGAAGYEEEADPLTSQPRSRSSAPISSSHSRTRHRGESMTRNPTANALGYTSPALKTARSGSNASTGQARSSSSTRGRMFRMDGSPVRSTHIPGLPGASPGRHSKLEGNDDPIARSFDSMGITTRDPFSSSYTSTSSIGNRGRTVDRTSNGLYFHRPDGVSINAPTGPLPHTAHPGSLGHSPARSAYGSYSSYAQASAAPSRDASANRNRTRTLSSQSQGPRAPTQGQGQRTKGFMEVDKSPRARLGFGYGHISPSVPNTAPPAPVSVFGSSLSSNASSSHAWNSYAASIKSYAESDTGGSAFESDSHVMDENGGETARASPTMGMVPLINAPPVGNDHSSAMARPLAETFGALVPRHNPHPDGPSPAEADRFALSFAESARGRHTGTALASSPGSASDSRSGSTGMHAFTGRGGRSHSGSGSGSGGSARGSRNSSTGPTTSADRARYDPSYAQPTADTGHLKPAKSRSRSRTPWDGERYEGGVLGMVKEQETEDADGPVRGGGAIKEVRGQGDAEDEGAWQRGRSRGRRM